MHSSRMHTALSLTVSHIICRGKACMPHTPLPCHACLPASLPHMPPPHACSQHACPLPCTSPCHACPLPHTPCLACPLPCNPPPCMPLFPPHMPPGTCPQHTCPPPCTPRAMHAPLPRMPPTTHAPPSMHTNFVCGR